jgi:excisionase family DNA binding protein
MKLAEVAEMLRLSKSRTQEIAKAGMIAGAWRTSGTTGHWRFHRSAVEAHIAQIRLASLPVTEGKAPVRPLSQRKRQSPVLADLGAMFASARADANAARRASRIGA